jgi:cbb3-type cytochrome oxidase maturation protein
MSIMVVLIGCSLLLAIGFLLAFIWSVKSGQMDDDYTPSVRMLFDDYTTKEKTTSTDETQPINTTDKTLTQHN